MTDPSLFVSLLKYRYFHKPEGQDPFGKFMSLLKYSLPLSVYRGFSDVCHLTQYKTIPHALTRFAFHAIPLNTMSLCFTSVAFMSTRVRGKDDVLNHLLGAYSCVTVASVYYKAPPTICMVLLFGATCLTFFNFYYSRNFSRLRPPLCMGTGEAVKERPMVFNFR